jgi:hypothetical protein
MHYQKGNNFFVWEGSWVHFSAAFVVVVVVVIIIPAD